MSTAASPHSALKVRPWHFWAKSWQLPRGADGFGQARSGQSEAVGGGEGQAFGAEVEEHAGEDRSTLVARRGERDALDRAPEPTGVQVDG